MLSLLECSEKEPGWKKDSRARSEFDPEPIPDCNVELEANVVRDFLFHEMISNSVNEYGYLHRITRTSLWWQ